MTHYTYEVLDQITESPILLANTSSTMAAILDLLPYTEYVISVSAWTAAGQGPFSDGIMAFTDETGMLSITLTNILYRPIISFFFFFSSHFFTALRLVQKVLYKFVLSYYQAILLTILNNEYCNNVCYDIVHVSRSIVMVGKQQQHH